VVEDLGLCSSFDTGESPVHGVIGVSLDSCDLAVLHLDEHTTFTVARLTNASHYFFHRAVLIFLSDR
jgi:hypothetical protein